MKEANTTEKVEKETDTIVKTKSETTQKSKSLIIKLEDLVPFENHPYKVIDNEDMQDLIESIREHGFLNPLIVRPAEGSDGKYEIISGHRRFHAAQTLGMKKLPCTVHFIDRDAATVMMVDSNCQRTAVLPSEKAWAYRMKMDAMGRQGKRTDLILAEGTSSPVETKLRTSEIIAKEAGESRAQIDRYIRLTYLVPELLQFVDEGKIKMRPAVEMSYLDEEVQRDIVDCIDERGGEVFPSHAQTRRIREQAEKGEKGCITYEAIAAIMDEQKPNQVPTFKISEEKVLQIVGKRFTPQEFDDYVLKALNYYRRYQKKQREQGER